MAGDVAVVAVQDERDLAVGAQPHASAGAAGQEVRPAAAVEQQDPLATGMAQIRERHPGLGVQRLVQAAHVQHLHGRHRPPVHPLRQAQATHRQHALGPGRRRAEDEHRAGVAGAPAGDPARVVAGVALVLIGALVLLVDDDQAEIVDRREHGRARSDADARLAAAQPHPLVVALAQAERGVQDRHHVAEPRLKAPQHLRGQRDLRHEHDRRAAGGERRLHRSQVDLGLARSGDPLQQKSGVRGREAGPARSASAASSVSRTAR